MPKVLCVAALFLLATSCAQIDEQPQEGNRIVSLSPGITATLVDLGLVEDVVGRSSFCTAVDSNVPVVGDLLQLDYERLLRLNPTHVFVQETYAGLDQHLIQLSSEGLFTLRSWKVDRLEDIQTLHDDLLELFDIQAEGFHFSVEETTKPFPSPLLIMTVGSEGSGGLCFGTETYLDDLLVMLGGTNALQRSGWITLSLEDIGSLQPAAIIVVSDHQQQDSISGLTTLQIPIIQFVHDDVLIPSSKIVDVANELRGVLSSQ